MHRTIAMIFLFVLCLVGIVDIIDATTLTNDYENKLRQIAKANRLLQLPNALILKQAISNSNLDMEYFIEKTGLIDKIADRQIKELGIYLSVDLACYDYIKYLKNNLNENIAHSTLELLIIDANTLCEETKPLLIDAIIRISKEVEDEL